MANQTIKCIHSLTEIIFRHNAEFEERTKRFSDAFREGKPKHFIDFLENGFSDFFCAKFKLQKEDVTIFQKEFINLPMDRRELVLKTVVRVAVGAIRKRAELGGIFPPIQPILAEAIKHETRSGWKERLTFSQEKMAQEKNHSRLIESNQDIFVSEEVK